MVAADVLAVAFSLLGIPLSAKVLDCCSGDGALAFELSAHFGNIGLNDVDQKTRAQSHYDVRRPEFWQNVVRGTYEYVITKPPGDEAENVVLQAHDHCTLVALLLSSEKLSQMQGLLAHKTPSVSIVMGNSNSWLVWAPLLSYRNLFLDLSEADLDLRNRLSHEDWLVHLKERLTFAVSRTYPSAAVNVANTGVNNGIGANGPQSTSMAAAAAAAASSHSMPFPMGSHPFYPQSQFQPSAYAGFGYPDNAIEQYQQQLSYAAAKRGGGGIGLDASNPMNPYGAASIPGLGGVNDSASLSSAHLGANGASPAGSANNVKREVASSAGSTGSNSSTTTIATGAAPNASGVAGTLPNLSNASPFDFGLPLGSGYPGARAHPGASPYAAGQSMLPYYAARGTTGGPAPASPNQWQFQQAPWASPPNFAAHMAAMGSPGPNGTHVPGPYGAPQFNPAAILMDMDKLNRPDLLPPNAAAAAVAAAAAAHAANASGASPYGLHKPTAFKASNVPGTASGAAGVPSSSSPTPNVAAVSAAIEDQQLMLSQAEMLYLKGVHAAKQGKALEDAIDKYRSMYSKKDVITKVCKMKYRSAQRKLRIAKHIQRFPEISTMTQRQAERYISEKLRKSRNGAEGRGASADSESD